MCVTRSSPITALALEDISHCIAQGISGREWNHNCLFSITFSRESSVCYFCVICVIHTHNIFTVIYLVITVFPQQQKFLRVFFNIDLNSLVVWATCVKVSKTKQ